MGAVKEMYIEVPEVAETIPKVIPDSAEGYLSDRTFGFQVQLGEHKEDSCPGLKNCHLCLSLGLLICELEIIELQIKSGGIKRLREKTLREKFCDAEKAMVSAIRETMGATEDAVEQLRRLRG